MTFDSYSWTTTSTRTVPTILHPTILRLAWPSSRSFSDGYHSYTAQRAESKAYIQDGNGATADYPVGAHNNAIRISSDQLNGNTEKTVDAMTNNGQTTDIDSEYPPVSEEKINTAVWYKAQGHDLCYYAPRD